MGRGSFVSRVWDVLLSDVDAGVGVIAAVAGVVVLVIVMIGG